MVLAFLVVSELGVQFCLSMIVSLGQKRFLYNPQDLSGNQIQTFIKTLFKVCCMLVTKQANSSGSWNPSSFFSTSFIVWLNHNEIH